MDYPLLNIFLTVIWLFLWVLWIFLLVKVIGDIFRSHDLGGWGKAGWLLFVIVLPFLGALIYLVARGKSMNERELERAEAQEHAFRSYVRGVAVPNQADELSKLAQLRDNGAISDAEYQKAKEKLLA